MGWEQSCALLPLFLRVCAEQKALGQRGDGTLQRLYQRVGAKEHAVTALARAAASAASALPHPTSVQYCHFRVLVTPHLLRLKRRCICTMHPHVKMFARKGLCKNARRRPSTLHFTESQRIQVADNHINTLSEMHCIPRTPIR